MDINRLIATVFGAAGAIVAPVFSQLYGEGKVVTTSATILVILLALDWISGVRASKKDGSYGSEYGIDGVFRTVFILLFPALAHLLDVALGLPNIFFIFVVVDLGYHILQSSTANGIRAGWGRLMPNTALNFLTKWVKSELDAKVARAEKRLMQKRGE